MLVAIVRFPEVPVDRQVDFEAWFDWSNNELSEAGGLTKRRLLRAPDGSYTAIVEHASEDTFASMHATGVAARVQSRLAKILAEVPQATKYEVVADLPAGGSCCGGHGGEGRGSGHHTSSVSLLEAPASGGCCRDA